MYIFLENFINNNIFYTFVFLLIFFIFFIYIFKKNYSFFSFLPIFIFAPFFLTIILRNIIEYLPGEEIGGIDGWLSFLGGYLGAFITLGGVWWQLKHSDYVKKQETENFKTSSVISALHLIENSSIKFSDISETYLKNFISHNCKTEFKGNFFSYNKDLLTFFIKNTDLAYHEYLIPSFNLFDSFDLLETKLIYNKDNSKYQTVVKEVFFCEQLEIHYFISNEINTFLKKYPGSSLPLKEEVIKLLKNLNDTIANITIKYESYYDTVEIDFIKNLLKERGLLKD